MLNISFWCSNWYMHRKKAASAVLADPFICLLTNNPGPCHVTLGRRGRKQVAYTIFWTMTYKIINLHLDKMQTKRTQVRGHAGQGRQAPSTELSLFWCHLHGLSLSPSCRDKPQCPPMHLLPKPPVLLYLPCTPRAQSRAGLSTGAPGTQKSWGQAALEGSQHGKGSSHCLNFYSSFKADRICSRLPKQTTTMLLLSAF